MPRKRKHNSYEKIKQNPTKSTGPKGKPTPLTHARGLYCSLPGYQGLQLGQPGRVWSRLVPLIEQMPPIQSKDEHACGPYKKLVLVNS